MANANKKKAEGSLDKLKGEAKETYGKATDDLKKQAAGKIDKVKGEAKKKVGEFQKKMNTKEE